MSNLDTESIAEAVLPPRDTQPRSDADPANLPGTVPIPADQQASPVPSTVSALPTEERAYHHFLRTPRARWWRGLLAIASLLVGFLILNLALSVVAVTVDIATGRATPESYGSGAAGLTPTLFLANNLSLAALLPLSMVLQRAFFGQPMRWLSSVQGGFRWRWFGRAALIVVPLWLLFVGVLALIEPIPFGRLSADAGLLLVIILLTTPLQAAGEEYGFRGLIARAAGSWSADPRIALVIALIVANLLFMVAHLATDPWLIAYYFMFGVALGVVAWRTGGLEAPVLIHVVNNVILLLPMALFGDLGESFDRGPGAGGPWVLLPMLVLVVVTALIEWWARRNRIVRQSAPAAVSHG